MTKARKFRAEHLGFATIVVVAVVVLIVSSMKSRQLNTAQLEEVVRKIRSGATTLPSDGRYYLTGSDNRLTEDGIAYVTGSPPQYVLFPDWRGRGTKIHGTLWSDGPLKPGEEITILLPRTLLHTDTGARTGTLAPTAMQPVQVRNELRPGWYTIARDIE